HRVPASDSQPPLGNHGGKLTGERPVCKPWSLSCQHGHAALYLSAQQTDTKQHVSLVKHTKHMVNLLIAPDVNPFLPSAISTVSLLFISTDHCISVTGDVSGS
ncbi:unnamed protein product, partial [Staurois parvus]